MKAGMSIEYCFHSISSLCIPRESSETNGKGSIFFTPAKFCCYGMPCNAGQLYELWPVIQIIHSEPDHTIYNLLINCKRIQSESDSVNLSR